MANLYPLPPPPGSPPLLYKDLMRVELRTQHFNHYETVNLFWYRSYACVIPRSGSDRFLVLSTSYMTA